MSNSEPSVATTTKGSRTDPGWKHCDQLNEHDTSKLKCKYCAKVMKGGITRVKEHLMGKKGNVAACSKCPKEVREELWDLFEGKKRQRQAESMASGTGAVDLEDVDEDEDDDFAMFQASKKGKSTPKGPMDLFMLKKPENLGKVMKERQKQISIREACDKEARARVIQEIATFWYQEQGGSNQKIKNPQPQAQMQKGKEKLQEP